MVRKSLVGLFTLCLCAAGWVGADTVFLGGLLTTAANWSNGAPLGQDGTINVDGYGNFAQTGPWMVGSTVTVGGGATLTFGVDLSAYGGVLIVNDATITAADDIFVQGGTLILNEGSAASCTDDFEANNEVGRIVINGGTHSSGTGTGRNVGAQGNTTGKSGCGMDFRGGTITAGNFRFQINSESSVGGSAVLASADSSTTFSDAKGAIDIHYDWTGSWTVGSFGTGDWETLVTNPANGFTLDGEAIDATVFAATFSVIDGGTTLIIPEARANMPVFTANPVVKADGSYGYDYALLSQTLAGSATNAAGGTVIYTKEDGPDWLQVASDGTLSGTADDSRTNEFTVSASAGLYTSTGTLQIYVEPLGNSPVFTNSVMTRADGISWEDYALQSQTLAGSATDADPDTLVYSKGSGPEWLNVASNGVLSGICDTWGTNTFEVMVDDGNDNSDTAILLIVVPAPSGGTTFLGNYLTAATNWSNGLPSSQNPGTIPVDGFYNSLNQATVWMDTSNAVITVDSGAVLTLDQDFAGSLGIWTVNDATINCIDDFFVEGGDVTLNEGSATTAVDDWETNNKAGRLTVNGGVHSSGPDTGNYVGAQGGVTKVGCGIDFRGGIVTAGDFRFQDYSVSSVGGSAVLASASDATAFVKAVGVIDMLSGWTGSWTVGSFGAGDWEALVTDSGNGFQFDGEAIDATVFAEKFRVSEDGKTLTMIVAAPVTLSLSAPAGGNMGLSWVGDDGVTYLIQTNLDLTASASWGTWMTTNSDGAITIDLPTTADRNFYRVISE